MKRPFSNRRPLGPFINSGDQEESQSRNQIDVSEQEERNIDPRLPDSVDLDELQEFKDNAEGAANVSMTMYEAWVLKQFNTPMLQSYIANTLREVARADKDDKATLMTVVQSTAVKDYSYKVGSREELERVRELIESTNQS